MFIIAQMMVWKRMADRQEWLPNIAFSFAMRRLARSFYVIRVNSASLLGYR
jgi:hypothetical protein